MNSWYTFRTSSFNVQEEKIQLVSSLLFEDGTKILLCVKYTLGQLDRELGVLIIILFYVCPQRSVAYVEWKGSCRKNIYRVGHIGKVNI